VALSSTQLAALKTDIQSSFPGSSNDDDTNFAIAAAYNTVASPAFKVWRTKISRSEVMRNFVWTEFIGRSQGERDAFQFMLSQEFISGADVNIRQGFADIFSGGTGATSRANLTTMAKRDATRAEKMFAVGTGTDASPAVMTFEGVITYQDVSAARAV
jgi:hypothetical protein